ncbi:MAG: RNA polymerase sigma factor [Anaerolineales bacterium]
MVKGSDKRDLALIKRAQSGDVEAFGEIYQRHAADVYRYFKAHLNDAQDAEDLLADVFLRTWKALPSYYPIRRVPFRVFLFRIARNRLIDYYRRQNLRHSADLVDDDLQDLKNGINTTDEQDHFRQIEMQQIMKDLRDDYRTVLELRFFGGLTPNEIAQVMERSEGAIRVLQHRALAALHKLISKSEK